MISYDSHSFGVSHLLCRAALAALLSTATACSSSEAPPADPGAGGSGGAQGPGGAGGQGGSGGSSPLDGREYAVVAPSSYDGSVPTPMIVMIHQMWAGDDASEWMDNYLGITAEAEKRGILVAIPQGTYDDTLGSYFWNVNESCCSYFGKHPDDTGFIMAMIDEVKKSHNVDNARVYMIGQSNGGFMAHHLACDYADTFAAFAAVSGAVDPDNCAPSSPVSVIHFHGTSDDLVPYDGGTPFDVATAKAVVSAQETVKTWATTDGCDPSPAAPTSLDLVPGMAGDETTLSSYQGCKDGTAAALYTIEEGEHLPEFDSNQWATLAFDFLMAHPKVGAKE